MAKAIFQMKDGTRSTIEDIEDLSMQPPYWMIKYKNEEGNSIREFASFDNIFSVSIEGEEELIRAAKAHVGDPQKLARDLGLDGH